jgi:hypothetical protein
MALSSSSIRKRKKLFRLRARRECSTENRDAAARARPGAASGHRDGYYADPRVRPMDAGLALYARRRDGSEDSRGDQLEPARKRTGVVLVLQRDSRFHRAQARRAEAPGSKTGSRASSWRTCRTNCAHRCNGIIGFAGSSSTGRPVRSTRCRRITCRTSSTAAGVCYS